MRLYRQINLLESTGSFKRVLHGFHFTDCIFCENAFLQSLSLKVKAMYNFIDTADRDNANNNSNSWIVGSDTIQFAKKKKP